jgi:succinate dehydrogenase/fumarate reductase flavoprotein subunit
MYDTIEGSDYLGDQDAIEYMCKNASATVYELEQSFRDIYGLGIKVFRKSGATWLETMNNEDLTLEIQNAEGIILQ